MSRRPTPPRGMRDVLPSHVRRRRLLQNTILATFESYGFEEIETPMLEDIDRLLDSEAGDNAKLIYKVLKRGLQWDGSVASDADAADLGLRYDLTVPLARFFATNQAELATPFKAIQIGPAFRAERPQKGRFRQFTQCDIDVLGDSSPLAEAELICATIAALRVCGIDGFKVRFNHRKVLDALLRDSKFAPENFATALVVLDKLDKIGMEGVERELMEIEKLPGASLVQRLDELWDAKSVEAVAVYAGERIAEEMTAVQNAVRLMQPASPIDFDVSLVRGQGYYTGPIFEITHGELGGSLAGGGRYDNMVQKLSGIDVAATGMSIGFERLDMLCDDTVATDGTRVVLLHQLNDETHDVLRKADEIRSTGASVRTERTAKNQRAQLERLSNVGVTHFATTRDVSLRPIRSADDAGSSNGDSKENQ